MIAHDMFFGPFWGVLAGLASALFWVAVIVVVAMLLRRGMHRGRTPSALAVLEERYARGEISREEFLERRGVLLGEGRGESSPASG